VEIRKISLQSGLEFINHYDHTHYRRSPYQLNHRGMLKVYVCWYRYTYFPIGIVYCDNSKFIDTLNTQYRGITMLGTEEGLLLPHRIHPLKINQPNSPAKKGA